MGSGRYVGVKEDRVDGARNRAIAPAHKTGVGSVKPETDEGSLDTAIELLDKGLGASRDFLKAATSKEGRADAAMSEEMRKVLDELIKSEAEEMVEALPYGKALVLAFKLSVAFANGAGQALVEVNKRLIERYQREIGQMSDEVDERTYAILQDVRTWQAHAVGELDGILAKGLEAALNEFLDFVGDYLKGKATGIAKDVCGQLAKQMLKRFDLLAIFSQGIEKMAKPIPEGRGRVERTVFSYVAQMFLDQLPKSVATDALQGAAKGVRSEGPVDAKVLTGLMSALVNDGAEEYGRAIGVDEAKAGLREMIIDKARAVMSVATGVKLTESKTGKVAMKGNTVEVPPELLAELNRPPGEISAEERRRFFDRHTEYLSYVERHRLRLTAIKVRYQKRVDRTAAEGRDDVWVRLNNQLVQAAKEATQDALGQAKLIHREFGDYVPTYGRTSDWFDNETRVLDSKGFALDRRYGWP